MNQGLRRAGEAPLTPELGTNSLEVRAYAKVNLTLDVLGRRADGYHEIDSLVQTVDLFDSIKLGRAAEMRLEVEGFDVPADERNLIWQACVMLRERYRLGGAVAAVVRKRIPPEAGLGGASSDAAAALTGTCRLYGVRPGERELWEMAQRLGSDVPSLLTGGTVRIRGRGEIVEPLPDIPTMAFVIVWPGFGVPTAQGYELVDRAGRQSARATAHAVRAVLASDVKGLAVCMSNDFEPVVCAKWPELAKVKRELERLGAQPALLSGSGSAMFGVACDFEHAREVADKMRVDYEHVWAVRTVKRSEVREGLGWTQ